MNQTLGLRVLGEILRWDNDRARTEFAWLILMSRLKYDGYRDFLAGARFIESLADWLQQFAPDERECAYQFVRTALVYVTPVEIQHLVDLTYPEVVEPHIIQLVADRLGMPPYLVWSRDESVALYERLLRQSLFLGLSDGARIDAFRRVNAGRISNEQVVVATQFSQEKWDSLVKDLRSDTRDDGAAFHSVFLVDDFVGTGTTLLRKKDGRWSGKLQKFWDESQSVRRTHFTSGFSVIVHHYIATDSAREKVEQRHDEALQDKGQGSWFSNITFTFGTVLPTASLVTEERYPDFLKLIHKYYDPTLETTHTELGGSDLRRGFGECGLPLVLEHNTPNNSLALLWADTDGDGDHPAMRPLFRRRQRHS